MDHRFLVKPAGWAPIFELADFTPASRLWTFDHAVSFRPQATATRPCVPRGRLVLGMTPFRRREEAPPYWRSLVDLAYVHDGPNVWLMTVLALEDDYLKVGAILTDDPEYGRLLPCQPPPWFPVSLAPPRTAYDHLETE